MDVTEADDVGRPHEGEADIIDVEYVAVDGSLAGLVRIDVRRESSRFLAAVLRPGEKPVVVIDHELPPATTAFQFRASGVWTEFICVTPLDHWTIALEAFGLALEVGEIATPESFGDRVAVGLDLDLDTADTPRSDGESSHVIPVRVHGEVLVADAAYEIEAIGVRRRRWDGRRPTSMRHSADFPSLRGELTVGWPPGDGEPSFERRAWFGGTRPGWCDLPVQSGA